ncbi:MAG: hypothetical protein JWQ54_2619 [Mucilaginibacter sp.]|nr:hypothetical protein [Mucilaginibacter sp.]
MSLLFFLNLDFPGHALVGVVTNKRKALMVWTIRLTYQNSD